MLRRLWQDAVELARNRSRVEAPGARQVFRAVVQDDSFRVTLLQRLRETARAAPLPGAGHPFRVLQTAMLGVDIGNKVRLGKGVYFVHPVGIVIGGDAIVGDRVRFYGSNTVGSAKDDGYPVIEDDVWVGAGARILGPVRVGARSRIGANAVVLSDVPPDHVAVGIPARVFPRQDSNGHGDTEPGPEDP